MKTKKIRGEKEIIREKQHKNEKFRKLMKKFE